jgi:hypothetical protein
MLAHGRHNDPVWQAEVASFSGENRASGIFDLSGPASIFRTFTVGEVTPGGK